MWKIATSAATEPTFVGRVLRRAPRMTGTRLPPGRFMVPEDIWRSQRGPIDSPPAQSSFELGRSGIRRRRPDQCPRSWDFRMRVHAHTTGVTCMLTNHKPCLLHTAPEENDREVAARGRGTDPRTIGSQGPRPGHRSAWGTPETVSTRPDRPTAHRPATRPLVGRPGRRSTGGRAAGREPPTLVGSTLKSRDLA